MTEKRPDTLDRLWDELPIGDAPIAGIVAAGQSAKRRRRRSAVAGIAAATALVVGGGVVTAQTLTDTDAPAETPVADRTAVDIEVTVKIDDSSSLERGTAMWDPEAERLLYASRVDHSGSCPPSGAATAEPSGVVALELSNVDTEEVCTADARTAVATITDLATPPQVLRVTENDETRIVPVATAEPPPGKGPDAPPRGGSPLPQLAQDSGAPVPADLARLAEAFVRYAVGDSDTFPHGNSVSMSLGGEGVKSVDDISAALTAREIWSICPADWEVYGASSCPVNLLGPVIDAGRNDATLLYTAEYGDDVACAPTRTGPLPEERLVVLRPGPEWRSCASDFALVLAADEQGRLRSIDLTLSEP